MFVIQSCRCYTYIQKSPMMLIIITMIDKNANISQQKLGADIRRKYKYVNSLKGEVDRFVLLMMLNEVDLKYPHLS